MRSSPPTMYPVNISFPIPAPSGPALRSVFSFILTTPASIILIDAGVAGSEQQIFDQIRRTGRRPDDVSLLILTHAHPDHIGAAEAIREASGCSIAAHPADRRWIEDTNLQDRERPVPGFSRLVGGPVPVDRVLNDGDVIRFDSGSSLEVIYTPGHSPGSVSLLLRPDMVLFSGDAIPVPGDLPIYDDPDASLDSIERLMTIEGITALFPSWDEPKEGEEVYWAMDDGYARIQQVHEVVREMLADNPGIDRADLTVQVADGIGLPPGPAHPMLMRTVLAHVRALGKK
jgi:hydroxyacylglutathione hydrolase